MRDAKSKGADSPQRSLRIGRSGPAGALEAGRQSFIFSISRARALGARCE